MGLHDAYFTTVGETMLTNVASGLCKIIWGQAKSSNRNIDSLDESDIKALTDIIDGSSSYTGSGAVTSYIDNTSTATASVSCQLNNQIYESGGPVMLFGVWAKTDQPGAQDQLVFVARHGASSTISNILSKSVDPLYTLFISFGLRIGDWQNPASVQLSTIANYYATATNLDNEVQARRAIENRAVTIHTSGDTTSGDNQSIYGEKTFINTTKHSGNILPTASNLTIGENSTSGKWSAIHATTFYGSLSGNATSATTASSATSATSANISNTSKGISYVSGSTTTSLLSASSATTIIPSGANIDLGSSSNKFDDIYANWFNGYLNGTSNQSIVAFSLGYVTNDNVAVGMQEGSTSTNYALIAESGSANYTFNIGKSDKKWNSIYSNSVYSTRFYGSPVIAYAASSVSADTAAKTLSSKSNFPSTLSNGDIICLYFTYTNTATSPYISDGTNNFYLYRTYGSAVGTIMQESWPAQSYVLFRIYVSGSTRRAVMLQSSCYPTSTASGTTNIIPSANNTYNLGSTSYRWKNIYASGDSGYYIQIGYDTNGGSTSKMSIVPSANNYGYIGTSSRRFSSAYVYNLYANSMSGCATAIGDVLAGSTSDPVGCIRLVGCWTEGSNESSYIRAGTTLSGYSIYKATMHGGDFDFSGGGTYSGTWKLLTDLTEQMNTYAVNYALAVRIA